MQQTFSLTGLLAAALLFLSFFSKECTVWGIPLRKMDILQDIRPAQPPVAVSNNFKGQSMAAAYLPFSGTVPPTDSLSAPLTLHTAQNGQFIEDYTPEKKGLSSFFQAIDSIKSHKNTVRIAFLGDSFVEGDILLGDLRDTLQSLWGGNGVGFVPMTSEVARFKRTLKHQYDNWKTFGIVKDHDNKQDFGINGYVYFPQKDAFVNYEGADYFKHTNNWEQVRLFYKAEKNTPFVWQNLENTPHSDTLKPKNGSIGTWKCPAKEGNIHKFSMRFPNTEGLSIYGASLESESGFYLDNFSVRGNTGGKLMQVPVEVAQKMNEALQYDLVMVQFGLNAVTPSLKNLPWYEIELDKTFAHLRACFPKTQILVVSLADRAGKIDGVMGTMPSVPAIVAMERKLAQKHGLLFWDMYAAMGGAGTMMKFVEHRPSLANKDYTHLTHEGGKFMGYLFADFLLREQEKYQNSKVKS